MTRRELRTNEISWRATPRIAFRSPSPRAVAPNRKRRTFFARLTRALVNLHV